MRGFARFLENARAPLRALSIGMACAGGAVMLLMLVLVCANIVIRPFGESIRGTFEMSGYLCALAVGLCMPAAQLSGSHIAAGVWADALPAFLQKAQAPLCNLLCAALLFLVARNLLLVADYAFVMEEYIDGFSFSYGGMALGFCLGIGLHALLFIHALLCALCIPSEARPHA